MVVAAPDSTDSWERLSQRSSAPNVSRVEWLGVAVLSALLLALIVALLMWRDRRRGPVCPHCGQHNTFGHDGNADLCSNCRFDFRNDAY
jgi:NADH pyrophosphatase NudC (nudix superfamily)